jgi:hypothetical protein
VKVKPKAQTLSCLSTATTHARVLGQRKAVLKKDEAGDKTSSSILKLANLGLDTLDLLVLGHFLVAVLERLLLVLLLGLLLACLVVLFQRVLSNGLVRLLVHFLEPVRLNVVVDVAGELRLVALLVVVGKRLHVLGDVASEDVLAEHLGVELFGLHVVAWEAVLRVRDVQTAVRRSLHDSEDASSGRGSMETHVQETFEWTTALAIFSLGSLGQIVLAIGLLDTSKVLVEPEFLQRASGQQQSSTVAGRPVGQPMLDAIAAKLVGIRGAVDLVAGDFRSDNLADDIAVCKTDDEPVLGSIVFVLGLADQALPSVVVGLSGPTAFVLGLIAAGQDVS